MNQPPPHPRREPPPTARSPLTLPLVPLDGMGPVAVADMVLSCPLRRRANLVVLQPHEDAYAVLVKRGSLTLGAFRVTAEIGNATVMRLALMADLDPIADGTALDGGGNAGRLKVRVAPDFGELLLCIGATADGLDAEIRPLSVNGKPLEHPQRGQLKRCVQCAAFQPPQRQTCEFDGGILIDIADDPRPGGTIGPYRVGVRLGDGGMGTVLAGEHALIGRPVAIKLLHRSMSSNPVMARRFLAEARAASRIHHPNVVDVTDFGLLSDGRPYLIMERLIGESLEARLDRTGALDPAVALLIAHEVALALHAAHDGGVVHRDLKPSNVIMLETSRDDAPRLKLVDFGAAYLAGAVTEDGDGIIGTPAYMSPEHARGEATDGRSDLYALGVVLYEMLTGNVPFTGATPRDVLLAHLVTPPPALVNPQGQLPQAVQRVVGRALKKKAAERHQSAAEMLADLERAISAVSRRDWRRWLPS